MQDNFKKYIKSFYISPLTSFKIPDFYVDHYNCLIPNKSGIYFIYDASDRLIYVGRSKSLRYRVQYHFYKSAPLFCERCLREHARYGKYKLASIEILNQLETYYIEKHSPLYNVRR